MHSTKMKPLGTIKLMIPNKVLLPHSASGLLTSKMGECTDASCAHANATHNPDARAD